MTPLLFSAAVTGAAATVAGQFGQRWLYRLVKPLPLLLLIVTVVIAAPMPGKSWLVLALVCAWLGDIALLFPQRGFLPGLLAFLFGHLAMLAALLDIGVTVSLLAFALALGAAIVMTALLWPRHKLLRVAVLAYGFALALVVTVAVPFAWRTPLWWPLLPAALLFAFSDGVLGWNKFRQPVPYAQLWILGSYFPAQCLFVYSFLTVPS